MHDTTDFMPRATGQINSSLESHACSCHAAKYSQAGSESDMRVGFLGPFGFFFLAVAFRFLEAFL